MMKFIEKYEKYVYPFMMILSLTAVGLAWSLDKDFTWQIVTFAWVSIAWGNFNRIKK